MKSSHVLAADIGGTKTELALFRCGDRDELDIVRRQSYASQKFLYFSDLLGRFLGESTGAIDFAAIALAGPVAHGVGRTTNLPWKLSAVDLSDAIGCPVELYNDVEALAFGSLYLRDDAIVTINAGVPTDAHRAVIAAGTGLGQAILHFDGRDYYAVATEGGHAAFSPRNDDEIGLLHYLMQRYSHVSVERVLSGPGLHDILRFLESERDVRVAPEVAKQLETEDPGRTIGEAAIKGSCKACARAVEIFVGAYGTQAACLALSTMALGGVYIGGGIVPKLLPKLMNGAFLEAFFDVGDVSDLLRATPVFAILEASTGLFGAGKLAARSLLRSR